MCPVNLYWVSHSSKKTENLMDGWRDRWGGGRGVNNGEFAGQCEHQHPPWWCWSQPVCPGDGWAVGEGDSSSSARGGLVLSWPTGGGHGRSLITLISTACAARGEMEVKRWRGKKMEGKRGQQQGEMRRGGSIDRRHRREREKTKRDK